MGIPGFFGQFIRSKNYKGGIINTPPKNVCSLSIDMNGIFHQCAAKVYAYHETATQEEIQYVTTQTRTKISALKYQQEVFFPAIESKVIEIIETVKPRDIIILSVDGVAPMAKVQQQRKRRYRKAHDSFNKVFDSNCLTPGTPLMGSLDKYLQEFVKKLKYTLSVIYSSHMVVGEGEQKIMGFLEHQYFPKGGNHVIVGMDADLILLSMLQKRKIYIMRSSDEFIDVSYLKKSIQEILQTQSSVNDFVFLMTLIGNDFIPHYIGFKNILSGINLMLKIYRDNASPLTGPEGIIWESFYLFLQKLVSYEPQMIQSFVESNTIDKFNSAKLSVKTGRFIMGAFYNHWYHDVLGSQANLQTIEDMSEKYLQGLAWVYDYYTHHNSSNSYYYPYHHTPLLIDVLQYLQKKKFVLVDQTNITYGPLEQLVAVIPPSSAGVLPKKIRDLVSSQSSPLSEYLPTTITVDYRACEKEFLGIPLVPFANINCIIQVVSDHLARDPNSKQRAGKNLIVGKPLEVYPEIENIRQMKIHLRRTSTGYNPHNNSENVIGPITDKYHHEYQPMIISEPPPLHFELRT